MIVTGYQLLLPYSIGAIYIDNGLGAVRQFIANLLFHRPEEKQLKEMWLSPKRYFFL